MPRATEPRPLTKAEARRIWLRAQRLDTSEPFGAGPQAVAAAVDHLGYVQIDTINVIERCHHHILYSRIPAYSRADLRQAQSVDKSVFEYWTHALSYVPAKDFRYFVPAMREHRREGHRWFASVKPEDTRKVMDPVFGQVFIYEHCLPFDVSRAYDEASGIKTPRIWTAQRDIEMWKSLQS